MADVIITVLIGDLRVCPVEQKAIEHKLCADLAHLRGCERSFQFALQIVQALKTQNHTFGGQGWGEVLMKHPKPFTSSLSHSNDLWCLLSSVSSVTSEKDTHHGQKIQMITPTDAIDK